MAGRLHTSINSDCNPSLHMDNNENIEASKWLTMSSDAFSATHRTPFTSARPLFHTFLTTQRRDVFPEPRERFLISPGTNLPFIRPIPVPQAPPTSHAAQRL